VPTVAKGNDGNLLQHAIEAEIAVHLAIDNSLHIVCTHGMKPFEPWENPRRNNRLVHWIGYATQEEGKGEPAIVRAYRALQVSPERYPNTGEVVASLLTREKLTGFISEVCPEKLRSLRQAWSSTGVITLFGSWRQHLGTFQEAPPDRPWLFTMDPMSFFPDQANNQDDDRLYPLDLHARLRPVWERFLATEEPGAISLFSFELMRGPGTDRYQLFLDHTRAIARNLGLEIESFEVSYGNPHVGAVLTKDKELLRHLGSCWKRLHDMT
jgi:hypothetical protein